MNSFWKSFLASLLAFFVAGGFLFVVGLIAIAVTISTAVATIENILPTSSSTEIYKPSDNSMLVMDFSVPIVEEQTAIPILDIINGSNIFGSYTTQEATTAIMRASYDPTVESIFLNLSLGTNMSLANIEEVRRALKSFQGEGKTVYAYADAYSQDAYYLASIADEIYLNPAGAFSWVGIGSTSPYFKDLLDKLNVEVEVFKYGKFKSAVEPYFLSEMSSEARLQSEELINDTWSYVLSNISAERDITTKELNDIANNLSVSSPSEALKAGLVDKVGYLQDIMKELDDELDMDSYSFNNYVAFSKSRTAMSSFSKNVEVIYINGTIMSGESTQGSVGDVTIVKKIERAVKDDNVEAIVIRVNSPGGSALASDIIDHAVINAKKKKPVIISMGAYAASGGYYVSANADAIMASPFTVTGSIGVFGLGFNASKLANEVGVNFNSVSSNRHADIGTPFRKMTPMERNYMQKGVDSVYVQFVNTICKGREMTFEEVNNIAEGRVWSAQAALDNGLIDKIGGLQEAIMYAADMADLGTDYGIVVRNDNNDFLSTLLSLSGSEIKSIARSVLFGNSDLGSIISDDMVMLENIIKSEDKIQAITSVYINL